MSKWIPVKDKLPESQPSYVRGETYIITINKTNGVGFAKYKEGKWIGDFGKVISDKDVIEGGS